MEKIRLDIYLVENKIVDSRNKATTLIKNNKILVNNKLVSKPNFLVSKDDEIKNLEVDQYVSRAAYKLIEAIKVFKISIIDKVVLDIGSSTGGFTQVLLENNAKLVYALDVGTNQLHKSLKENHKVISLENTNFKDVENNLFENKIDFITCDVSFISLEKILLKIKELNWNNIEGVFLLKPQFETTKEYADKNKGFVDNNMVNIIINKYKEKLNDLNISLLGLTKSPIKGAKLNNEEFLLYLKFNNKI